MRWMFNALGSSTTKALAVEGQAYVGRRVVVHYGCERASVTVVGGDQMQRQRAQFFLLRKSGPADDGLRHMHGEHFMAKAVGQRGAKPGVSARERGGRDAGG